MLKLENITLGYGKRTVLSGINLEVAPGELLG
ncbi:MAG TPA: branched-chain amino acid ABC transporter ATP-binding protein, partial [Dehalococcoidia bacterium]|nr:branched-chain amino acid ABC transporter ATP-binding protein [Dehalococcoidia bacterium]